MSSILTRGRINHFLVYMLTGRTFAPRSPRRHHAVAWTTWTGTRLTVGRAWTCSTATGSSCCDWSTSCLGSSSLARSITRSPRAPATHNTVHRATTIFGKNNQILVQPLLMVVRREQLHYPFTRSA